MAALHTICYVSKAHPSLTKEEISVLFKQVNHFNDMHGVTGILTYAFGRFFQVLEGDPGRILPLFENNIKKDERHTDVFEIYNGGIGNQIFLQYSSKFKTVTQKEELENIEKYLSEHPTDHRSEKITRLLKPFLFFD